jgi:hypothetical protein
MRFRELPTEILDDRVLGAVRFVDATTGAAILEPLQVAATKARFVRNRSGFYVIVWTLGLQTHLEKFEAPPPPPPALGAVKVSVTVSAPSGRYLPRTVVLELPRDANPAHANDDGSLFRAVQVSLFPSPTASIDPGWAVVRASVRSSTNAPLPGAFLRLRRASQPTTEPPPPLARGLADDRGEALIPVAGVPVTNFQAADTGPVLSTEIDAVLEAYHDTQAGSPPDPDVINARRLLVPPDPHALPKASVNVRLASGKAVHVSVVISS